MKKFSLEDAVKVCNAIVDNPVEYFSGLAVAVVDDNFDMSSSIDLRPNNEIPNINYFENPEVFISYLNKGSKLGGVVHDGFHFMKENGQITHSARYFVPKVVKNLPINEKCGIRYHSGLYGSVMRGVKFIITISSNTTIYIFKKGEVVYMKKCKNWKEIK